MTLCEDCNCQPPICDCCRREVDQLHSSCSFGEGRICLKCFSQWYDPDNESVIQTSPTSIGNYVRKKHGLAPLADLPAPSATSPNTSVAEQRG